MVYIISIFTFLCIIWFNITRNITENSKEQGNFWYNAYFRTLSFCGFSTFFVSFFWNIFSSFEKTSTDVIEFMKNLFKNSLFFLVFNILGNNCMFLVKKWWCWCASKSFFTVLNILFKPGFNFWYFGFPQIF